jgi:hypothetical protein
VKVKQMNWDEKGTKAWRFFCPGCQEHHAPTEGWMFNGDVEKPTFSPSILVRGTKITEKGWAEYDAWRAAGCPKRDKPLDSVPTVCHSFVRGGKIQFLSDCTHALAGQTVELPEIDD